MQTQRPIHLSREGGHFRLVFGYAPDIVEKVRGLPFAAFDGESKSWTVWVCIEAMRELRGWFYQGLVDRPVDDLVPEDEEVVSCPPALLNPGTARRPYVVRTAWRDDTLYARLKSLPGASWDKKSKAITFGAGAAVALREMVDDGVLADPSGLLSPADTTVAFDSRAGRFRVFGDPRAQDAFDRHFPGRDVVAAWRDKGIDVEFADEMSGEVYRSELLRGKSADGPDGLLLPLFPYQAEAVAMATQRSGFAVFDAPGLGKTATGVAFGYQLLRDKNPVPRVVVVCPGVVRTQWRNEITRFTGDTDIVIVDGDARKRKAAYEEARTARWLIVHYDVLHRDLAQIQPLVDGCAMVVDEAHRCFPAGTTIDTESGPMAIEEIVDGRLPVRVATVGADGQLTYRPVVDWMSSEHPGPLLRIVHSEGEFITTPDHPVWTVEEGYVDACDLSVGQELRVLLREVHPSAATSEVLLPGLPHEGADSEDGADLSALWDAVPHPGQGAEDGALLLEEVCAGVPLRGRRQQGGLPRTQGAAGGTVLRGVRDELRGRTAGCQAVLWNELLGGVADVGPRDARSGRGEHPGSARMGAREEAARHRRADAAEEPDARPGEPGEGVAVHERQDVPQPRRERATDAAAAGPAGSAGRSADGVSDLYGGREGSVRVPAALVQGGPRDPGVHAGDRGGRPVTPHEEVEVPGSPQGGRTVRARVVRVEVLERGDRHGPGVGGAADQGCTTVFNIEVDETHNYFADGVLVHNCKNPTAKRTKALQALGRRAARRLALTGTPVESVPDEWFNVLSFAVPGSLGGAHDFLNRYMFPNRWGGYEGARNLGELRDRSRWHYLRHTKDQVATHLPPLRVQHMVLDPDPTYAAALKRAHREAREEIARERLERAERQGQIDVLDGDKISEIESGSEMTAVGMLRLLCTSPRAVAMSDSPAAQALAEAGVLPDADGPKLDELREIAMEMQKAGERVVIFTFSKKMAQLVAERFTEDGTRFVLYTGDSTSDERETARLRFTDPDDDVTAFIATDAGAEGLNLGRCCSTLINLDIPWTPSRLEQRSNRIHRVDGTAPRYLVINMTLRGTIEEGILRMVEAKADLSDSIFGESGGRERTTGRRRRRFDQQLYDLLDETM